MVVKEAKPVIRVVFQNFIFFWGSTVVKFPLAAPDMGHCWPGEISHHHTKLLPQCKWCGHCLWHHQTFLLWKRTSLDGRCEEICWQQHYTTACRWVFQLAVQMDKQIYIWKWTELAEKQGKVIFIFYPWTVTHYQWYIINRKERSQPDKITVLT